MTEEQTHSVAVQSPAGSTFTFQTQINSDLPSPTVVAQWDQLVPGAAREILDMAVREQQHRHQLEKNEQAHEHKAIDRELQMQALGQLTASLIILVALVGVGYLLIEGKSIAGLAAIFTALATIAGILIFRRKITMSEEKKS